MEQLPNKVLVIGNARDFWERKPTQFVSPERLKAGGKRLLCDDEFAYGVVELEKPVAAGDAFHYVVRSFQPFEDPRPYERIEESTANTSEDAFREMLWRLFSEGNEGRYVALLHIMGLSEDQVATGSVEGSVTAHIDLLFQPPRSANLVGTEMPVGNLDDAWKAFLGKDTQRKFLVPSAKPPHPVEFLDMGIGEKTDWAHMETVLGKAPVRKVDVGYGLVESDLVPPDTAGATANTWARYVRVDSGKFIAGVQDTHFKEFWFDGEGKRFDGRWIFVSVPSGDSGGPRTWMAQRPKEQTMKSRSYSENVLRLSEAQAFPVLICFRDRNYLLSRTKSNKLLLTKP